MNRATPYFILLAVLFFGVIGYQLKQISKLKKDRSDLIKFSNTKDDSLKVYTNKLGEKVARIEVLTLSVHNTRELMEDQRLSFLKQFDGLHKRLNNLDQATKTIVEYNKSISIPIFDPPDSVGKLRGVRMFAFKDSLTSINGIIKPDTVELAFNTTVPIYSVIYWQRNKWLGLRVGKKKWISEVMSTNPNVAIRQHSNIQIRKK